MNNKGQIAIFIIVGVLIFVSLTVFFLVRDTEVTLPTGTEFGPERFMGSCVRQSLRETTDLMLTQGGFVNPKNAVVSNGTTVTYLCKNINYYESCIAQHPAYLSELQEELRAQLVNDIPSCLDSLKTELERRNYDVQLGEYDAKVTLKPEIVDVSIPIELTLTKNDVVQRISQLDTSLRIPLYNLGRVANELVSQEARFCYSEYVGYMLLYPSYDIRVKTLSDTTKVYSVTHLPTDKTLQFAIRGCVIPAGI